MSLIVLAHGIGQQYKGPDSLRAEWLPALNDGLIVAGGDAVEVNDVAVAFYGDLFRPRGRGLGEPDLDSSDVSDVFDQELLINWWSTASSCDPAVPGPNASTRMRTPYLTQRALAALSHSHFFAGITERSFIFDLRQVRQFFTEPPLRKLIIDRVSQCITSRTRVVIGHSLGSVASYEALCAHPEWKMDAFITLGSPLGIRGLIFDRLIPPPHDQHGCWPGRTKTWINIADRGDIVAAEKFLAPLFGSKVIDREVNNGSQAHNVLPYLTARETGEAIRQALERAAEC